MEILQIEGDASPIAEIPGQERRDEDPFLIEEIPERADVLVGSIDAVSSVSSSVRGPVASSVVR